MLIRFRLPGLNLSILKFICAFLYLYDLFSLMIRHIVILLLFCYSCVSENTSNDFTSTSSDKALNSRTPDTLTIKNKKTDTIFIYREVTDNYYHAIFIDTHKKSEHFNWLTNFEFNDFEEKSYNANKEATIEERPGIFKNNNTHDLPQNWLPLYKYKQDYYLYAPSDWGNAGKRIINNQEFIYWYMDGPYPVPIISVDKASETRYTLTTMNPFDPNEKHAQITIHIIDPMTKMAVFEFSDRNYQLYVPAENAEKFDLIVNHCEEQKQREYQFDEINYEELINSH